VKIWTGFGSEHSYRLVLVGHFQNESDAVIVEERYEQLQELGAEEVGNANWDEPAPGFSKELYERLEEAGALNLSRPDIEGFAYIEGIHREGKTITCHTDDAELQGLLKIMFDQGARVEIYSSKHWSPDGELLSASTDSEAEATQDVDDNPE